MGRLVDNIVEAPAEIFCRRFIILEDKINIKGGINLVKVANATRDTLLADADVANNFFSRAKGLLGKKWLDDGSGLIIKPCKQIHCFGMKFDIDAVFIDKSGMVCHICHELRSGQISKTVRKADCVIELPAGTVTKTRTEIGDHIIFDFGKESMDKKC